MIGIYKYYSYILYISGIRWWFHTLSYNFESFLYDGPQNCGGHLPGWQGCPTRSVPKILMFVGEIPDKKTLRSRNCRRSRRSTLSDSDLGEALPKDEEVFGGLDFFSVWLDTIWGFENVWKSGAGFNSSSHPDHDGAVDLYRAVDFLRPANDDFLTQLITAKPVVGPPVSMVNWFGLGHEVKRAWWNCWTFGRFLYLLMFHAGHIWSYLIISGHIWSYLVISGHIWSCWSCMMLLLATLQSCHCWVYLAGVVAGSSDQLEMYNIW